MNVKLIVRLVTLVGFGLGILYWILQGLNSTQDMPFGFLNGWMAMPIIAVSVIPIVWSMTSGPSRSQFAGQPIGIGTLVEAHRTGLTVNDQPQLDLVFDVETAEGHTFRGTARQIVDLTELAMLTPGITLPVRYRPDHMDGRIALALDADPEEVQDLMYRVQYSKGKITVRQIQIAEHGVDAQALVMEMRPTGEVRDGDAVIGLLLRVTRPDGSTFDARVEKSLAPVALPGVQPGTVLRAKYLTDDEQDVSIEVRMG